MVQVQVRSTYDCIGSFRILGAKCKDIGKFFAEFSSKLLTGLAELSLLFFDAAPHIHG